MDNITINGRKIGVAHPPYIIAELSANHNGDLQHALDIISMAKKQGADAVKLQTYTADTLTINCDKPDFQISGGLWDGYTLYDLYDWAHTPYEWHKAMFDHARTIDITCFSTPFDETAVDLLEDLNAPAYKIASFEAVDIPLIRYVASTKKPMIISTGMANLEEIEDAVTAARENGCKELALLHCISSYPAPNDQSNLLTIQDIGKRFDAVVGLSDHTMGTVTAVSAVALGAGLIEKHVTMSRENKGPDSEFSLEPEELNELCVNTKIAWESLGSPGYERKPAEHSSMKFRRSIYVVKDVKKGEVFTEQNVKRIRPGFGLAPKFFSEVIGATAHEDIARGTALQWSLVQKKEAL